MTTTQTIARRVDQVTGMPISLALRGRHARDAAGEEAWQQALLELRWVDVVFSTWRADSQVSRLGRGELTVAACHPTVAEVLRLGEDARVASGGAFDVWLPGLDGVRRLDPSGVVKGWAVDRAVAPLLALPDTDVCLSAGGDMVRHVADPDGEAWSIGIEDSSTPRASWPGCRCTAGRWRPRAVRTAARTWSTRGPASPSTRWRR